MAIALWGPSGSGKSSLITAFGVTISRKYNAQSDGFNYTILDEHGQPKVRFDKPFDIKATDTRHLFFWEFIRQSSENTPEHKIRSQHHRIRIYDDKGDNNIGMLDDPDTYRPTLLQIVDAESIILLLDPKLIKKGTDVGGTDVGYTKDQYFDMINQLVIELKKHQRERNIAVCLTKIDTLGQGVEKIEAWNEISSHFDRMHVSLTGLLKKLHQPQDGIFVEAFAVSTQIDPPSSSSKDQEEEFRKKLDWSPLNVEYPFFWLFEQMELRRVRQNARGLFSRLFMEQRVKFFNKYAYPKQEKWS